MKKLVFTCIMLLFLGRAMAQWTALPGTLGLGDQYGIVFSNDSKIYAAGGSGGWASTDNGNSWTKVVSASTSYVYAVDVAPNNAVYFGNSFLTDTARVLKSTDGGTTFTTVLSKKNYYYKKVCVSGNGMILVYGEDMIGQNKLYKSTDGGATWTDSSITYKILQFKVYGNDVYYCAMGSPGGIYHSSDNGNSFSRISVNAVNTVHSMCKTVNGDLYAGIYENSATVGIVMYSADNGGTWNKIYTGKQYTPVNDLEATTGEVYAALWTDGVKYTKDKGATWTDTKVNAIIMELGLGKDGKVYVNKSSTLSYYTVETGTSIKNNVSDISVKIYPNPATDKLIIRSENEINSVSLFNLQGQQLVNENCSNKEMIFDLQNISAGIYFVKIITGNQSGIYKIVKE